MAVELDRDTTIYPDGNIVEVRDTLESDTPPTSNSIEVAQSRQP